MWAKTSAVLLGLLLGLWYFQDDQLDTLKDKKVLVTGGSTGIGEQVAYQLASLGSHVVVTSRRLDALLQVTKRCQELSPQNYSTYAVVGDMSNLSSAKSVTEETVSLLGGLDMIVLNHIFPHEITPFTGSPENISLFDKVIDVNFRSYVHLTAYALPQLIANHGRIIVVSSMLGRVPHPYLAMYASSKHALHGFFDSLRSQFIVEGRDVSITICTLGFIGNWGSHLTGLNCFGSDVGTDNAIRELEKSERGNLLRFVKPASPTDTAKAIVTAAARRANDIYYPYWAVMPTAFLRNICPQLIDWFMRYVS